ncbi:efflux RND transporter periplasmic adaptor subunit [Fulvivirgaceae bacterium PWU5]|uniref:Efflux RND transporter periplasmic adaptor subunit n=1 Tax=Dawidia cretensis TaxID=2782350 RepID=A0AAP2E254_9BACT|nr:efflux RND transporter periplasmic adaptor subunit [Dawidia cretensis]MBT1711710.1 efflux RND transporter periplasmic adaptor subunit [Dawidia cretensis]
MKKNWINNILPALVILLLAAACRPADHAHHDLYTCPMHPTVVSEQPGTCPVCGMDLVRQARDGEAVEITPALARTLQAPNEHVLASTSTVRGIFKAMPLTYTAPGTVAYDTRALRTITARLGGRLEKVYLRYSGQPVRAGQPIAELYSPELMTAQRELLYLVQHDPGSDLLAGARRKLLLLGATTQQIENILRRNEPVQSFTLHSPYDGYILTGSETPATIVAGTGDPMNAGATTATSPAQTRLPREGDYIARGQALYRIASANALRIELTLPAESANAIAPGDSVQLIVEGQQRIGTVAVIEPVYRDGAPFVTVRVHSPDTKGLRPGQIIQATFTTHPVEALWVPRQAVVDLGLDKIVFVQDNGTFRARKVTTGIAHHEWIAIRKGLTSTETIAAQAQYLVDSEGLLNP